MLSWLLPKRTPPDIYYGSDALQMKATPSDRTYSMREFVETFCTTLLQGFKPSSWLPNGHFQTAYCVTGDFSKIDQVEYERRYIRLPDGGTLGIDITPPLSKELDPSTPLIVVQHGLTGGSQESYVRNVLSRACASKEEGGLGYRAAVVNFRGCAGVPLTSPRFYSAASTDDLKCATLFLSQLFPQTKAMVGLGFSLGASVLVHYLAEEGSKSRLKSGCVLACPWNMVINSHHLEERWFHRTVYSKAMGKNLVKLFNFHRESLEPFPTSPAYNLIPQLAAVKNPTLRQVDDIIVSKVGGPKPHWPFKGAWEYYEYSRSDILLNDVRVPLLAISSKDDPIVAAYPTHAGEQGYCAIAITERGGHLGWFEDAQDGRWFKRWISQPCIEWLRATAEEIEHLNQPLTAVQSLDGFTVEVDRPDIGYREIREEDLPVPKRVEGLTTGL